MRTVVAVDWSEQSFNAVKVVCRLFTHEALTLIHAVDLRPFETPLYAQPLGRNSAGALREGMVAAGERLLDQTGALVPVTIPSIQRVYKIGTPAPVVLEAIRLTHADLVRSDHGGVDALRNWSWAASRIGWCCMPPARPCWSETTRGAFDGCCSPWKGMRIHSGCAPG